MYKVTFLFFTAFFTLLVARDIEFSQYKSNEVLLESPSIKTMNWKTFEFVFTPDKNYNYIILEAYFKEGIFSHKGNILIDNLRPILRCGGA